MPIHPQGQPQPKVKPTPLETSCSQAWQEDTTTRPEYAKPKPKKRPKILDTAETRTGPSHATTESRDETTTAHHSEPQPATLAEERPPVMTTAPRPRTWRRVRSKTPHQQRMRRSLSPVARRQILPRKLASRRGPRGCCAGGRRTELSDERSKRPRDHLGP